MQLRDRKALHIGVLALGILVLLVLVSLFLGRNLDERHLPGTYSENFDFDTGSFATYQAWAQQRLREAHAGTLGEGIITDLAPFRLEPASGCSAPVDGRYEKGIVLTHGLLSSPYAMRDIGAYFQSRCFLVLGLLLPGHGTRPGDLLQADWSEWARAESFAVRDLAAQVDELWLGGHAEGGTLALLEAASGNAEVAGLVVFAPQVSAPSLSWQASALPLLSRLAPSAGWAEVLPDEGIYHYESYSYGLVREAGELVEAMRAAGAGQLAVPILTVASAEDTEQDITELLGFMSGQADPLSHTLLFSQHESEFQGEPRVVVRNSHVPEDRVLSLSHEGLMIELYNPHYGIAGAYRDCRHYLEDEGSYESCKTGEENLYGELTGENLGQGVLQRSTFNLFMDVVLGEIDAFIFPGRTFSPRGS